MSSALPVQIRIEAQETEKALVALNSGSIETKHLVVRAFDDAGQGQPELPDTMWNFAGYLCTAWHHVHVLVE